MVRGRHHSINTLYTWYIEYMRKSLKEMETQGETSVMVASQRSLKASLLLSDFYNRITWVPASETLVIHIKVKQPNIEHLNVRESAVVICIFAKFSGALTSCRHSSLFYSNRKCIAHITRASFKKGNEKKTKYPWTIYKWIKWNT